MMARIAKPGPQEAMSQMASKEHVSVFLLVRIIFLWKLSFLLTGAYGCA
jgi:hypothetical protein